MKVAFKDESFAFEFVRNLGFTYYGGADIGEMMAPAGRIQEGDLESWFTEWDKLGRRILSRADASLSAGHLQSAREANLRASTYFRTAEFYLHGNPQDPRILSESRASQQAYAQAAKLWTFGTSDIIEFLKELKRYTMDGIAGQIQCPCLVMEAENDMFFRGQPQQIYDALKVPKQLFKFTSEDGAENHCQSGAVAFKDEVVFNC